MRWLAIQTTVLTLASVLAVAGEPTIAGERAAARIQVDVAVLSATGEAVKGLSGADFEIYSNGKPVPIASCTPGPAPLNVVLLVDASGSMRWQMREEDVKDDVKDGFIPAVKSSDRVRIGSIGAQNYLSPAFTSSAQELKRAADRALDAIDAPFDLPSAQRLVKFETERGDDLVRAQLHGKNAIGAADPGILTGDSQDRGAQVRMGGLAD